MRSVIQDCEQEGIPFESVDRSKAGQAVKKVFLKTDSIGKLLNFELPHRGHPRRRFRIKLEIDSHPPAGSEFETRYIQFPITTAITVQTLPAAFAGKLHALLCRPYTKGRDWYDFLWYIRKRIHPKLDLLSNALEQMGPWQGVPSLATPQWIVETLTAVIDRTDWAETIADVGRFLPTRQQAALLHWGTDLFNDQLQRLMDMMS